MKELNEFGVSYPFPQPPSKNFGLMSKEATSTLRPLRKTSCAQLQLRVGEVLERPNR